MSQLNKLNVLELLLKARDEELSRKEMNFLVEYSYKISIAFLKSKFLSQLNFLRNGDITVEDIAIDAIIPLYINNTSNQLGICRSLEMWNDSLKSKSDADYFLSRIIWRRVDQTVTKLYKQRDPIFDKILKVLNVNIKKLNLCKVRYFGTVYIMQDKGSELVGEVISENIFNSLKDEYFGLKHKEMLPKLFEYLLNETDYAPAIPMNALVKRIKYHHAMRLESSYSEEPETGDLITINEIVNEGLCSVKQKLNDFYLTKNRLTLEETKNIYSAFVTISKDAMNGGINDSLYKYLKDFDPTLSKKTFYSKYQNIMNYLLSGFKKSISESTEF